MRHPFRRRIAALDAGIEQARADAEKARREADRSEARNASVRAHVIEPLHRAGQRNQFADMLRASLIEGYGRGS